MMLQTHGVDVGDRMYILRVHEDRDSHELVQCRDLRSHAQMALAAEEQRLAASTPHAAAPAVAPVVAPTATPAVPAAVVFHSRPRGRAPVGKVWIDGQGWVAVDSVPARAVASSSVLPQARPTGRAPKGMQWSSHANAYVPRGKRASPEVTAPSGENANPNSPRKRHRAPCAGR